MAKRFRNREANEVRDFLAKNGFRCVSTNGDDDIYALGENQYTVKIPNRNEDIPTGTMMYIVKMIEKNGITRKEILIWWKDNGYGD